MQTRRSSVLGKRAHQPEPPVPRRSTRSSDKANQIPTPDPSPKRARTSASTVEGDHNKENVPPLSVDVAMASPIVTTPSRRDASARRSASTGSISPSTPTAEVAHLSLATPPVTPPREFIPVPSQVRGLLRPTANSSALEFSGRELERKTIEGFISTFVGGDSSSNPSTALYISGSPGCGKTALVTSILSSMSLADRNDVTVVSLNCMAFRTMDTLWRRIADAIHPSRISASAKLTGQKLIENILKKMQQKCLLVLDELDNITRSSQSLESFFSLFASYPDVMRIIGIANTHTLSSSMPLVLDHPSVNVIHFRPYTSEQLFTILESRLSTLRNDDSPHVRDQVSKLLPTPPLSLLCKKVASMTGDVRVLFEVLRGAIDLAVAVSSGSDTPDFMNTNPPSVTPAQILAALKTHSPTASLTATPTKQTNSETLAKVQSLGLQPQLVLLTIILATKRMDAGLPVQTMTSLAITSSPSRRSSSPVKCPASPSKRSRSPIKRSTSDVFASPSSPLDTNQLYSYYNAVLTKRDWELFSPVSRSEFGDLVNMLEGLGLLANSTTAFATKAKRTFGRSGSFSGAASPPSSTGIIALGSGVWIDEIARGMGITEQPLNENADAKLKGVQSIWTMELKKVSDELAANERARNARLREDNAFDDAHLED